MKKRSGRHDAIRSIVRSKRIRTQRALVDELKELGYVCTQATVSRDISEMGLRKLPEGMYVLAEDLHLQRMVSDLVIDVRRSDNLILIKTVSGNGPGVGAALAAADFPGLMGSLAGDDTILVIAEPADDGQSFQDMVQKLRAV